jgi:type II secretory pathway component PulF
MFDSGLYQDLAGLVLGFLLFVLFGLAATGGAVYLIYFLLTLPMRRNERARMFLDLLELGMKERHTPEAAIIWAAASHDRGLGVRFHLLAAHLEQGRRLGDALGQVPRLLPPQVVAMLRAGERIGDVGKVLPGCRLLLKDSVSQVRGALNYLLLLAFVITPVSVFIPIIIRIKILPAFRQVFDGMGIALPGFTRLVFASGPLFTNLQIAFFIFVWLAALIYIGGPRFRAWINRLLPGLPDRLACALPWRRKRLQRDFSAMLALLLEAGVPEAEAVRLSGECTANRVFRQRADQAAARLGRGVKLAEAIRVLDDSPELRWRFDNAFRRGGGFVRALSGWHEALDAKAFQLEQTAAQLATTALVLVNGLLVASIVIGMFIVLINLINQAVLW